MSNITFLISELPAFVDLSTNATESFNSETDSEISDSDHSTPPENFLTLKLNSANISEEYRSLFENYDENTFNNTLTRFGLDYLHPEKLALAGRILMLRTVIMSGSLTSYLDNLKSRLSVRQIQWIIRNRTELDILLQSAEHYNFNNDYFSASSFLRQYLLKSSFESPPLESMTMMFLRVASHLHAPQFPESATEEENLLALAKTKQVFLDLCQKKYIHASPTLYNAGTEFPQGSSCFLATLGDNLRSILGTGVMDLGLISKYKGGLGVNLTMLRHSGIRGAGTASGVVPVELILDYLIKYADQGGSRPGAATAYLSIWHIDIIPFIKSTDPHQTASKAVTSLNTAIWMHNLFFRRVKSGESWTMFCPKKSGLYGLYGEEFERRYTYLESIATQRDEEYERALKNLKTAEIELMKNPCSLNRIYFQEATLAEQSAHANLIEHETIPARDLMTLICQNQLKAGYPYIMNGDEINSKSNQLNIGMVNSSNLCVEITEVSTPDSIASCNLASLSLKAFALRALTAEEIIELESGTKEQITRYLKSARVFDFAELGRCSRALVQNLNQLIDTNFYPVAEKTETLNKSTRPLGIGVSGLADVFSILDLPFEHRISEVLNQAIFACMYYHTLSESNDLARMMGEPYSEFRTGGFSLARALDFENSAGIKSPIECAESVSHPGLISHDRFEGSPLANGFLQFDLWKQAADVKFARGELDTTLYDRADDEVIEAEWFCESESMDLLDDSITQWWNDYHSLPVNQRTKWNLLRRNVVQFGTRNSLLLTCMPTASSAQTLSNSDSTEPQTQNMYVRNVGKGKYFLILNTHFQKDFSELGLWNKNLIDFLIGFDGSVAHFVKYLDTNPNDFPDFVNSVENGDRLKYLVVKYKTAYEISQKTILKYARQRGIYVDQAQSMNIFMSQANATKVTAMHNYAAALGLKTGMYYLRQQSQVESAIVINPKIKAYKESIFPSVNGTVKVVALPQAEPAILEEIDDVTRDEEIGDAICPLKFEETTGVCIPCSS